MSFNENLHNSSLPIRIRLFECLIEKMYEKIYLFYNNKIRKNVLSLLIFILLTAQLHGSEIIFEGQGNDCCSI